MTLTNKSTLITLPLLAACSTGGLGNLDIEFGLTTSHTARAAGQNAIDQDGVTVSVDAAELYLSRIDFDLPDGESCDADVLDAPVFCDDVDTLRIEGPFHIDLATGIATPSLAGLTIPAGTYDRVELRLDPDDSDAGASFTATGTVEDSMGAPVPWSLALAIDEDARFEAPGGLEVSDATTALVLLDVAVWFADLPLSQCLDDGALAMDGEVAVLDDSAGCDLVDALEDAIKESGQVKGHDDDDDHPESEND